MLIKQVGSDDNFVSMHVPQSNMNSGLSLKQNIYRNQLALPFKVFISML